jgi:hypothetical protein
VHRQRKEIKKQKVKEKHVLVKLILNGHGHDALAQFKTAIQDLPDIMKVEVTDAYETDQSIFLLLNMSWESWVQWSMAADMEFVGVTCGPSLIHQQLMEIPVREFGENRRPAETGKAE